MAPLIPLPFAPHVRGWAGEDGSLLLYGTHAWRGCVCALRIAAWGSDRSAPRTKWDVWANPQAPLEGVQVLSGGNVRWRVAWAGDALALQWRIEGARREVVSVAVSGVRPVDGTHQEDGIHWWWGRDGVCSMEVNIPRAAVLEYRGAPQWESEVRVATEIQRVHEGSFLLRLHPRTPEVQAERLPLPAPPQWSDVPAPLRQQVHRAFALLYTGVDESGMLVDTNGEEDIWHTLLAIPVWWHVRGYALCSLVLQQVYQAITTRPLASWRSSLSGIPSHPVGSKVRAAQLAWWRTVAAWHAMRTGGENAIPPHARSHTSEVVVEAEGLPVPDATAATLLSFAHSAAQGFSSAYHHVQHLLKCEDGGCGPLTPQALAIASIAPISRAPLDPLFVQASLAQSPALVAWYASQWGVENLFRAARATLLASPPPIPATLAEAIEVLLGVIALRAQRGGARMETQQSAYATTY